MRVKFVQQDGLGRHGVLSSIGYELTPRGAQKAQWWASYTYESEDPDGAVIAMRRLAAQLEERLDGMAVSDVQLPAVGRQEG